MAASIRANAAKKAVRRGGDSIDGAWQTGVWLFKARRKGSAWWGRNCN